MRRVCVRCIDRRWVALRQKVAHSVLVACLLLARLSLLQLAVGGLEALLLLNVLLGMVVSCIRAGEGLHVRIRRNTKESELCQLLRTENADLALSCLEIGRLLADHLLVRNNILHDQVLIFFANCLTQLRFVVGDQLLNVHVLLR